MARASRKGKQPAGPTDLRDSSHSNTQPVDSSQLRPKAATTQLDGVDSGEVFVFEDIDDEDSDVASGPTDPSLQERTTLNGRPKLNRALDILFFFDGVEPNRGKFASKRQKETPPFKICKLCSEIYGTDKTTLPEGIANFMYGPKTGNTNLRHHLSTVHPEAYDKAILENKWPYKLTSEVRVAPHNERNTRDNGIPLFSPPAFLEHLVRFIVADDQSIRVIECPEFRRLCMVLCQTLTDADIPRRDKMREAVITQWRDSFEQLKCKLSKSCGRISFTADVWSNANLEAYLALTAHWISSDESSGRLALNAALIGFHRLKKRHTGFNIAKNISYLLDRADVTLNIGYFTLDNAENNAVAMQELEDELAIRETAVAVNFHNRRHRVRCYAHIINICSSHIISSMTSVSEEYLSKLKVPLKSKRNVRRVPDDESDDDGKGEDSLTEIELDDYFDDGGDTKLKAWFEGIKRDPLNRARKVIRFLRASDSRKSDLRQFIEDGNERNWFYVFENGKRKLAKIPQLQLLRDVKTRWDSVYMMLRRLRTLRPAIDMFFDVKLAEFASLKLSEQDWDILEGLETVLRVPHMCQHSMSSESTPVLSRAISSFEMFMTELENIGKQFNFLRPWTEIGLDWAKKYYIRMDDTDAYVVTMFLNPAMRFSWIEIEWGLEYIQRAKTTILTLMRQYRSQNSPASPVKATDPLVQHDGDPVTSPPPTRFKVRNSVYDRKPTQMSTVEAEFQRYVSSPVSSNMTNILRFWEAHKTEFPTLFSIAMDYLPIQATSVPCERVFSSAKDTDTAKRNRINPVLMEALQMLKHSLKNDRLNFMAGWRTSEEEMGTPVPTGGLQSLFAEDPDTALDDLLKNLSSCDDYAR